MANLSLAKCPSSLGIFFSLSFLLARTKSTNQGQVAESRNWIGWAPKGGRHLSTGRAGSTTHSLRGGRRGAAAHKNRQRPVVCARETPLESRPQAARSVLLVSDCTLHFLQGRPAARQCSKLDPSWPLSFLSDSFLFLYNQLWQINSSPASTVGQRHRERKRRKF